MITSTAVLTKRLREKALKATVKFMARPERDLEMERLGSDYGGWWVPTRCVARGSTLYSIGAGEDITFDIAMHARGCSVVVADPTPRAIAHVEAEGPVGSDRFNFFPVGLAGSSGTRRFYAPKNPEHVSHSVSNLQGTSVYFDAECLTLTDLMTRAGDEDLDVLKLDIEGAEHEVITSLVGGDIRPTVLCVEFDDLSLSKVRNSIGELRRAGYQAAKVEGRNVTFIYE